MNTPAIGLAVVLCSMGVALPALAGDIRAQLTPDLIYSHCQEAGVGSETEGTFMLPIGRVTGSVLCTDADLVAPKMLSSQRGGDEDGESDDDHRGRPDNDNDDDGRDG
jgi:hypothetical protein